MNMGLQMGEGLTHSHKMGVNVRRGKTVLDRQTNGNGNPRSRMFQPHLKSLNGQHATNMVAIGVNVKFLQ